MLKCIYTPRGEGEREEGIIYRPYRLRDQPTLCRPKTTTFPPGGLLTDHQPLCLKKNGAIPPQKNYELVLHIPHTPYPPPPIPPPSLTLGSPHSLTAVPQSSSSLWVCSQLRTARMAELLLMRAFFFLKPSRSKVLKRGCFRIDGQRADSLYSHT